MSVTKLAVAVVACTLVAKPACAATYTFEATFKPTVCCIPITPQDNPWILGPASVPDAVQALKYGDTVRGAFTYYPASADPSWMADGGEILLSLPSITFHADTSIAVVGNPEGDGASFLVGGLGTVGFAIGVGSYNIGRTVIPETLDLSSFSPAFALLYFGDGSGGFARYAFELTALTETPISGTLTLFATGLALLRFATHRKGRAHRMNA
jgi:hypothetical protein